MSRFTRSVLAMGLFAGISSLALAGPVTYIFTTISDPAATYTYSAAGINDSGQIVGNASGTLYLDSGGVFTTISNPVGPVATGINNAGQIVGYYSFDGNNVSCPPCGETNGFLDNGGIFTNIIDPLASGPLGGYGSTQANGINSAGQIVGTYTYQYRGSTVSNGFVDNGGTFTTISDPSADPSYGTYPTGINDAGEIVGYYNAVATSSFLDNGGIFTNIDDPLGTTSTIATGINDSGEIVGYYGDSTGTHGFLDNGGIFTTIDDPFSYGPTELLGINDAGLIVGTDFDYDQFEQAILVTPTASPEPSTLAMMFATALLGIAGYFTRKRFVRP